MSLPMPETRIVFADSKVGMGKVIAHYKKAGWFAVGTSHVYTTSTFSVLAQVIAKDPDYDPKK